MVANRAASRVACLLLQCRGSVEFSGRGYSAGSSTPRWLSAGEGSSPSSTVAVPYPRGAVAVTIQSKKTAENYYLLVKRANPPDRGKWSLPGGKIMVGEPTLDAARRELTEETQLLSEDCLWYPLPFMTTDAIYASPDNSDGYDFHYLIAQCFGRAPEGLPRLVPSDDALDAEWWTLTNIQDTLVPEAKVSSGVVDVITRAEDLCTKGAMEVS